MSLKAVAEYGLIGPTLWDAPHNRLSSNRYSCQCVIWPKSWKQT